MPAAQAIQEALNAGSWIRKMFEAGAELKKQHGADNVFDFSLGNPVLEPPEAYIDAASRLDLRRNDGLHRYMPNAGFPSVRQAIAESLVADGAFPGLDSGGVIMSVGAGGALNTTLRAILDPGDEVVILAPYFVEYLFYIRNYGGVPVIAETDAEFGIDLAAIDAAITPKTKAIIINSPNNPSGCVYSRASLEGLGTLLADKEKSNGHPIYLISDEPYRELVYTEMVPSAATFHDNSFLIYSWSKSLSIPGERIGYVAVNPKADDPKGLSEAITFTTRTLGFVNAPARMQLVAAELLRVTVDIGWYEKRRDRLVAGLKEIGLDVVTPEGAFYVFPKCPTDDDMEFVARAQKENVLLVPGRGFGRAGHVRICYCVPDATIDGGLQALARVMNNG